MEDAKGMDLSVKQDAKDMRQPNKELAAVMSDVMKAMAAAPKTDNLEQVLKDVRTPDGTKGLRDLLVSINDRVRFLHEKIEDQLSIIDAAEHHLHK